MSNNNWLDTAITKEINKAANIVPVPDKKAVWKQIEKELNKYEQQRIRKKAITKYISVAALVLLILGSLIIA
jgi:hypothetical protein